MISLYRRNNGLALLATDDTLQQAAQAQADAMAAANSLDHNVRGTLDMRLTAHGMKSARAAENVSAGYHTLAEAFSGWRQSPPHNRNLLMKGATRMGHRHGLCAGDEIQGLLGADPRRLTGSRAALALAAAARRAAAVARRFRRRLVLPHVAHAEKEKYLRLADDGRGWSPPTSPWRGRL